MFRLVRSLAAAIPTARTHRIEGAGHAAPFDATTNFVQLIADNITSYEAEPDHSPLQSGGGVAAAPATGWPQPRQGAVRSRHHRLGDDEADAENDGYEGGKHGERTLSIAEDRRQMARASRAPRQTCSSTRKPST